jgi:hypothetical protein
MNKMSVPTAGGHKAQLARILCAQDSRRNYPGPGHYPAETAFKAVRPNPPAISIANRCAEPSAKSRQPGPGEYNATGYRAKETPGVSIKFRHPMGSVHETPAPHDYADKDFISIYSPQAKRKGISFGIRHKAYTQEAVPGPQYQVGGRCCACKQPQLLRETSPWVIHLTADCCICRWGAPR